MFYPENVRTYNYEKLLKDYKPEPLYPEDDSLTSAVGDKKLVDSSCVDLVRRDYLNMSREKSVKQAAIDTIRKYGVGTCGPRSFFGILSII